MSPAYIQKTVISSDGTPIYAQAVGNRSNPCLVLVHGFALSSVVFDGLFQDKRLLANHYLVAYDMRGHGRSGMPSTIEGYASSLYADDFAAVLKVFGVKRCLFIGWSLGGTVSADILTNLGTDVLTGIVYIAGAPYIGPLVAKITTPLIQQLLGDIASEDANVALDTRRKFVDALFEDPESIPMNIKWTWMGCTVSQIPEASKLVVSRSQDPTKLLEAGRNGLPLLLTYGTDDLHVNGKEIELELAPDFANMETHAIQGGGHTVFYENKDEFVGRLLTFAARTFNVESY